MTFTHNRLPFSLPSTFFGCTTCYGALPNNMVVMTSNLPYKTIGPSLGLPPLYSHLAKWSRSLCTEMHLCADLFLMVPSDLLKCPERALSFSKIGSKLVRKGLRWSVSGQSPSRLGIGPQGVYGAPKGRSPSRLWVTSNCAGVVKFLGRFGVRHHLGQFGVLLGVVSGPAWGRFWMIW